ncbi:hypothetical protein DGG96_19500 [Legionella qingyii]|uniref:Uncharacterized protein n=1 Tax=Legionella qingyii TaxID=2184757 RepID=A0A317TYM2_9GAMM|nr:hypothetical protein [Legionella qingyii]PWY53965.1 hypothetical protein DGG96_19500 [Legionella qingyii]RUR18929.1 hypothetical protein ELY20_16265 [Legionella qingyii]RUR21889.1 hypothetical protein ELY16_15665 [Legionella qingyii]
MRDKFEGINNRIWHRYNEQEDYYVLDDSSYLEINPNTISFDAPELYDAETKTLDLRYIRFTEDYQGDFLGDVISYLKTHPEVKCLKTEGINSSRLEELAGATSLTSLDVSGSDLGDECLPILLGSESNLTELNLQGTFVTNKAVLPYLNRNIIIHLSEGEETYLDFDTGLWNKRDTPQSDVVAAFKSKKLQERTDCLRDYGLTDNVPSLLQYSMFNVLKTPQLNTPATKALLGEDMEEKLDQLEQSGFQFK